MRVGYSASLLLIAGAALAVGAPSLRAQVQVPRPGQQAELARLLDRLSDANDELQTALPRFECTETVVTRRTHKGKDKDRVDFTATLRAQRSEGPDSGESYEVKTLHGKPTNDTQPLLPLYVRGGFDSVLLTFGRAERACYTFTLTPGDAVAAAARIDFAGVPQAATMLKCSHVKDLHGFVLLDANGDPTHIERSVPLEVADQERITPFAAVDLAPVELNGRTYQLSKHLVSSWPHGDDVYNFEATYSGCHEFASTVKILPGSTVVPEASKDAGAEPR